MKPRILIAASIYPPDSGGPALHASKHYEFFQREGYHAQLVALAHFRMYPKGIRHMLYFVTLLFKAFQTDVLYAHDVLGVGLPAVLVSIVTQKKLIMRIGGDLLWEREAEQGKTNLSMKEWYAQKLHTKKFAYSVIVWVLRHVDRLIVPSPLLVSVYTTYYGVAPQTISVIANPIPTGTKEVLENTSKTIVFASRLVAYKNLSFVLQSMKHILPQFPDVKLSIFGDGPERDTLEHLVQELGIGRSVIFNGLVTQHEVERATNECLFTLAPALTEFNPNYVLQGISVGKPFLISSENGFPFSVPSQFVFDPRNTEEFERCLIWMLSPAGYQEATSLVQSIPCTQSWDNNLKQNRDCIDSEVSV